MTSMVLYCLIPRTVPGGTGLRFLLVEKQGHPTFPPTKFRPGEDLFSAIVRPMEEDLGLSAESYCIEEELPAIPNSDESPRYPGLSRQWLLYPVIVSLTEKAFARLDRPDCAWRDLKGILQDAREPNIRKIAQYLRDHPSAILEKASAGPSMDALACHWVARQSGGVRVARKGDIRRIVDAGSRAFNLRVADPYLPYQKQGLGFTWSFFTPRDRQDLHVHGLPAVEIYGVLEGRLQIWHKPMNQRGVRTWRCITVEAGDWVEVEPLHCHLACWAGPEGLGTVVKAAGAGELAGVGKLGVSGKTTCEHCPSRGQCAVHPRMTELLKQYSLPYEERDYALIASLIAEKE